ncbi:MAG: SDR family NAD(P)-dependent oxidoreductase [Waterburya sp.]
MMINQLLNYKTVITGSSEGIGFGIAEAFARNGAAVWLLGRDLSKLKQAHEKLQQLGWEVLIVSLMRSVFWSLAHFAIAMVEKKFCLQDLQP